MKDLKNKIIVITKNDRHVELFEEKVIKNGGILLKLPTTTVVTRSDIDICKFITKLISQNNYQYCIFLSPKAVDILFGFARKLDKYKALVEYLNYIHIISVGPKTFTTLVDYGIHVDLVPNNFSSEGIFELFSEIAEKKSGKSDKGNIIIPRSERGDDYLKKSISKIGFHIDEFFLYTVVTTSVNQTWFEYLKHLENGVIDSIIFTSPSSVQSFFELSEKLNIDFKLHVNTIKNIISIGPLTSKTLKKYGILCTLEPKQHSLEGIFSLLIDDN